jgi:hypothetical protein
LIDEPIEKISITPLAEEKARNNDQTDYLLICVLELHIEIWS